MARKLALLGALGALLVVALMLGGQSRHAQADAPPDPLLQAFNMDITECMNIAGAPVDPGLGGGVGGINCDLTEPKTLGTATDEPLDVALPSGNRIGIPFYYSGPGWFHDSWGSGTSVNGRVTGDVKVVTDLLCDGVADLLAAPGATSPSWAYTPEVFKERTTAWGPTTNTCPTEVGGDESFLDTLLPGPLAMTPVFRQLACLTELYLGYNIATTPYPAPLTIPVNDLNSVTLQPNWPQPAWGAIAGANPMKATTVLLGGSPTAPSPLFFTCRDTPQDSLSHTYANAVANPPGPAANAGIYVRWATELSEPDHNTRLRSFTLTTNCKSIGGVVIADADSDCLEDTNPALRGGSSDIPWEGKFTCTTDTNWDSDGDGLPDGVEAAWGSDPCVADTDADGRTDLEEMIGPAEFLTIPVDPDGAGGVNPADSDGDTVPDGGYKVGAADLDGNPGTVDAGREVQVSGKAADGLCATNPPTAGYPCWSGDGSSHTREAYDIAGTDVEPDGAGRDNCPSKANPAQTNTDLDTATTLGAGDISGDACDNDDDNDSLIDGAELTNGWSGTACNNLGGAATNPLDADSDNDGILDGIECDLASNPANFVSRPVPCGTRLDRDNPGVSPPAIGDLLCWTTTAGFGALGIDNEEVNWRTDGISGALSNNVDGDAFLNGDADADTDGDTLTDACEVLIAGTSPMAPDTDGDTVTDKNEVVGASAGAIGNAACSAPTLQYTGIGNGVSVNAPSADDVTVPNSRGGRTADTDMDGLLNYNDPNPGGDITYDDDGDGMSCIPTGGADPTDTGPSWDRNCNGKLDGPEAAAICPLAVNPTGDDDGDGLLNTWEVCKWGTNPKVVDSDDDGKGDCIEACDTDGNGLCGFGDDALNSARATLLPAGTGTGKFGKDGDFDLNGNNLLSGDFGNDTIRTAQYAFKILACK